MTVRVEKYVLPKFKVAVTLDKPFYARRVNRSDARCRPTISLANQSVGGDVQIYVDGIRRATIHHHGGREEDEFRRNR